MNISFSTIGRHEAEERLKHEKFSWLPEVAKAYVLENLGDLRVQCTMMYPKPQIEFHGERRKEHYDKIMNLLETKP